MNTEKKSRGQSKLNNEKWTPPNAANLLSTHKKTFSKAMESSMVDVQASE